MIGFGADISFSNSNNNKQHLLTAFYNFINDALNKQFQLEIQEEQTNHKQLKYDFITKKQNAKISFVGYSMGANIAQQLIIKFSQNKYPNQNLHLIAFGYPRALTPSKLEYLNKFLSGQFMSFIAMGNLQNKDNDVITYNNVTSRKVGINNYAFASINKFNINPNYIHIKTICLYYNNTDNIDLLKLIGLYDLNLFLFIFPNYNEELNKKHISFHNFKNYITPGILALCNT